MNFSWLTNLWPFAVAMLNIWSIYFGVKVFITVLTFVGGFISSFLKNMKE